MLKTVFIVCTVLYFLVYFYLAIKTKKPFKTLFLSALAGIVSLTVINLTNKYTGTYLPVNPLSVGISSGLGLPGVIGLLLLRLLFKF